MTGAQFSYFRVNGICLDAGGGTKLTVTANLALQRTTTGGEIICVAANDTITGTGGIYLACLANAVVDTIPAILYLGSGNIFYDGFNTSGTIRLIGNQNMGAATVTIAPTQNNANTIFDANGYGITCGVLQTGCASATNSQTVKFGSGTFNIASFDGATKNTGAAMVDSFQTAIINVSANINTGTNHTTVPGTAIFNVTGTSTITSNSRQFTDSLRIASSGTVTLADDLVCGALNIASGTFDISAGTRDSVHRNINLDGTLVCSGDTLTANNIVTGSGSTITSDAATLWIIRETCPTLVTNGKAWPTISILSPCQASNGGGQSIFQYKIY